MKGLQHSLKMSANTWHARWYRHYLYLGGKRPAGKENLCHYMKVLFILAPLRWLFKKKTQKGRLYSVVALRSAIILAILTPVVLWPEATALVLLEYVAVPIGIGLVVVAGIFLGVFIWDDFASRWETLKAQRKREGKVPDPIRGFSAGVVDTVKLIAIWLKTKKNGSRACPYVEFEQPSDAPTPNT